jgi:ubiquinone/menaquinone biosynthesis C-methylase UbiE
MSLSDRIHFRLMSLVHEDLYGLFRDPYTALRAAGLEPGHKVLEVGCGPGFFTVPAAKMIGQGGTVYALDVNPLAIEKVRHKVERAGVSNVKTVLADAAQTGLPEGSFDLAFVFGLAHPIGGLENILNELYRLLKPGGTLSVEGRLRISNGRFQPVKRQGRISQYKKQV